jgi:hypothetical protein
MNISAVLGAIIGLHALFGIAWLAVSLHAAFGQTPPISVRTRKAQGVLAVLVFFLGLVLWRFLHAGFGPREAILLGGVGCAICAAGLQHGMGRASDRKLAALPAGDTAGRAALARRVRLAEIIASALLTVALVLMLVWRQA